MAFVVLAGDNSYIYAAVFEVNAPDQSSTRAFAIDGTSGIPSYRSEDLAMLQEPTGESRTKALTDILAGPASKLAPVARQSAALLGIMALVPGVELPPAFAGITIGLGINAMSSVIDQVALRNDIPQDHIRQAVENAVSQSGIEQLLTNEIFFHAYSHLLKAVRSVQNQNAEIVATLGRLESVIHRLASVESESQLTDLPSEVFRRRQNVLIESIPLPIDQPSMKSAAVASETPEVYARERELATGRAEVSLSAALVRLLSQADSRGVATSIIGPRPDSSVLPPTVCALRQQLVTNLIVGLSNLHCMALVGGPGSGKTQLARALAKGSGANAVRWVLLGGRQDPRAHLEEQLALWLAELSERDPQLASPVVSGLHKMAENIAQLTGQNGLLIIDDLPDPTENELLFSGIEETLAAFSRYGSKVITTSQREPPTAIQLQAGSKLTIVQAPPFLEDDVRTMLKSAGAPLESMRGDPIPLIWGTTHGHALLVAATVGWMKKHDWQIGKEELIGLLGGEPIAGIRDEEIRRLPRFLDEEPRRLLYRYSLLNEAFDRSLAMSIASVRPAISHPGESLQELVGPSLDRLEGGRLKVNPLLREAGKANLPADEQQRVHWVTARHYLSQETIEAAQVFPIFMHLMEAGNQQAAVGFLVQAMVDVKTSAYAQYFEWVSGLWVDTPWPAGLGLNSKIILRASQVKVRALAGRDATALNEDLEKLIQQAVPENYSAVIFADGHSGPFLNDIRADVAVKKAVRMVRLLRQTALVNEKELGFRFEDVIWLAIARLEGVEGIRVFNSELAKMTDEERIRLFRSNLAIEATSHLIDRAWVVEATKPADQRDWEAVIGLFDRVRAAAALWQLPALQVSEARARAIVLADYLGQREEAIGLLETVTRPVEPDLLFLLDFTVASALYDAGNLADALARFDATVGSGSAFGYYRLDGKMLAAIIKAKQEDMSEAARRCIDAIHTAARLTAIHVYDRLAMMGELAWIHWTTGNRQKAFAAMYGVVSGLTKTKDIDEPRFREFFSKAAHALGWFVGVASTGCAPARASDGGEYAPLHAGFFGIRRENLQTYSPPRGFSKALLLTQLGLFADEVGLYRSAWQILEWSTAFSDGGGYQPLLDSVKLDRATLAALFGEPEAAIRLVLEGLQSAARAQKVRRATLDVLTADLSSLDAWQSSSPEERKDLERQLLSIVFGPMFAEILARGTEKSEALQKIMQYEEALAVHREELQDAAWWDDVISFLKTLVLNYSGDEAVEGIPKIPEDNPVLTVLGYLAYSRNESTMLRDSFVAQVNAVSSLIVRRELSKHMLPAIGRFVHNYWVNTAHSRGFALRHPQLFREQLRGIPPEKGAITAVRVLKIASRAIDVAIPQNVLQLLNEVDRSN